MSNGPSEIPGQTVWVVLDLRSNCVDVFASEALARNGVEVDAWQKTPDVNAWVGWLDGVQRWFLQESFVITAELIEEAQREIAADERAKQTDLTRYRADDEARMADPSAAPPPRQWMIPT